MPGAIDLSVQSCSHLWSKLLIKDIEEGRGNLVPSGGLKSVRVAKGDETASYGGSKRKPPLYPIFGRLLEASALRMK
jgi:hypothetical protein